MTKPPQTGRRIDVMTRPEDFHALEDDWNRLWDGGRRREIFTSFPWAKAYFITYTSVAKPAIAVARRKDRVSAILPMAGNGSELRFIGYPHSDYCDILCDERTDVGDLRALVAALWKAVPELKVFHFNRLNETSAFARIASSANWRLGFPRSLRRGHLCPLIDGGNDPAAVFGALMRKENPRRCERRLSEKGAVSLRHIETREAIRQNMETFFDQHRRRRMLKFGSGGMFEEAKTRMFFLSLVDQFDPAGPLRFAVLTAGEKPVAFHFGFELDGRYIWYVPTFDVAYRADRPGLVMLRHLFDYAIRRGLTAFDFTIGDEEYKSRFANRSTRNLELSLFPKSAAGFRGYLRENVKRVVYGNEETARLWRRLRSKHLSRTPSP
jgi:CelD/BcsL family acetyltransferase involved in cellulose biosynthesis